MKKETIKVEDHYPITVRTTPDGQVHRYITDKDLKDYTKPKDLNNLYDFLYGQTRYIEGTYLGDVERWLNSKKDR